MSEAPPEDKAPSKIIEVFLWAVFIVPMIFVWITAQSIPLLVILLVVRLGIMVYPRLRGQKQPVVIEQKKEETSISAPKKRSRSIITIAVEELVSEWKGLLKFLRIYDYEAEEKYLKAYREIMKFK